MTSLVRFAYVMAVRKAVSGWRLEAVLFGGILLAVALMASGDVFSNLVSNAALRHALVQADPEDANFWVRSFSSRDDPPSLEGRRAAFQGRSATVQERVSVPMERFLEDESRFLDTATFFFQGYPQLETDNEIRPRGGFASISGLYPERARVIRGEWPADTGADDAPLPVAVDELGAELLQLDVGDVMEVYPAASFTEPPPTPVRIVGVFQRLDPEDEFWYSTGSAFSRQDDRWTIIPLFTTEEVVIDRVLGRYPSLYTDTTWHFFLDREAMRASDVEAVQQAIANIERDVWVELRNSSYSIKLDSVLRSFDEQLLLARVPLLLVVFLVVGILVYYLALVAGLVVRSRSNEIAMLRSRGATTVQLGVLGLGEGLLLAAPAVAIGPFLAAGVVRVLGNVFFSLGGGADELAGVPVGVTQGAFLLGLGGGILAVAVFTIATLAAARSSIVDAGQAGSRPPTASILHRYYLDLALLALIGLLWWQLQSRGAFISQSVGTRELQIDQSLLLGPVLGLVAAGLIIMRVFPWAAALLSRLVGPVGPSWLVHSLRHVARAPMIPGILIVLLTLATALGVMGSAFSATLERSQRERALYTAGADLRLLHTGVHRAETEGGLAGAAPTVGVAAAADVLRANAHITTTGFSTSTELLAVDSSRIDQVAWFREDFARGISLGELAGLLSADGVENIQDGIPVPPEATGLGLWVLPSSGAGTAQLWGRLRDSAGRYGDTKIGEMGNQGWRRLDWDASTPVTPGRRFGSRGGVQLSPPFTLISLMVSGRSGASHPGSFFVGRLDALTPDGEITLADFSTAEGWEVIQDFSRPGLYELKASSAAASPEFPRSTRYSWATGGVGLRGFRAGGPIDPLPLIVNPEFLEVADAEVGDEVVLGMSTYSLPFRVVGVADFFPTLDPGEGPFAIVDLAGFRRLANLHSPVPPSRPNETWVRLAADDTPVGAVVDAIEDDGLRVRKWTDAASLVEARTSQPLVGAGWGALLVLLFLAVALASASGVMLFSYLDTRERQTEYALLRTLGSSGGQLKLVVWFNLFLMVACGVGMGTWLGQLIGRGLLPLMEVAEEGARIAPSMVFTTDWRTLTLCYVVLAAVTAMTVLWLAWLSSRVRVQQVLRMGDA